MVDVSVWAGLGLAVVSGILAWLIRLEARLTRIETLIKIILVKVELNGSGERGRA